jgi:hypothetical protein
MVTKWTTLCKGELRIGLSKSFHRIRNVPAWGLFYNMWPRFVFFEMSFAEEKWSRIRPLDAWTQKKTLSRVPMKTGQILQNFSSVKWPVYKLKDLSVSSRVARWHIFQTKIPVWVNFGGSCKGRCWYILWSFSLFYGHLLYFVAIWKILRSFAIYSPVFVYCTKKNMANMVSVKMLFSLFTFFYGYLFTG